MTQLDTLTPLPHSPLAHLAAADVYRIPTGISNAYFVTSRHGGYVLVDAGGHARHARKIIQAAADLFEHVRPHAILLTHGHFDHAGGLPTLLQHWPDLPVFAHSMELPYLNGLVRYPPGDPTVGGAMAEMSRFMDTSRPTPLPVPVQPFPEESAETPFLPGWEIRPSPGHTPGHVSLWNQADRILIAGDAIVTLNSYNPLLVATQKPVISIPPPYATYNWHHARQSARALAELEPEYLLAGHGIPMHGPHIPQALRAFAAAFSPPRRGRYLHTPARFNRQGPTFIPPAPPDYVKQIAIIGAALATSLALYAALRPRKKTCD